MNQYKCRFDKLTAIKKEPCAPFLFIFKIYLDETMLEEYYPRVWGVVSASLHIVISLGQESIRYVKVKSHISLQRDQ
ncbi:MAG: hypothetical protein ACPG5V_14075, partial [Vibrio cyclitrophicus]